MPQVFGQEKRSLPARGQYLIRNAHVITMDRSAGDIAGGDVHIRNGEIVAVGPGLSAPGAKVIDGRGTIVLPGLVETHWHMWNSLLRSMSGDERKFGYFPTSAGLGRHFLPSEMYAGTRLATAEALFSGITTVHDWCHNPRTPQHADENLRALRESGIRARFSYGPARGIPITETVNLADIERLHRDWRSYSNENLLTLGLAWRGVQYAVTDKFKLYGAYYYSWQNDYNRTAVCNPGGAGAANCAGSQDTASIAATYQFNKNLSTYAGITYSMVHGGTGFGYLATSVVSPTVGMRYRF